MEIGTVVRFVRNESITKSLGEQEQIVTTNKTFRKIFIQFSNGSELPYNIRTDREDKDYEGLIGQNILASVVLHKDGNFVNHIEVGEDNQQEADGRRTGKTERKRQNKMNKQQEQKQ